jgi:hypothetical protein
VILLTITQTHAASGDVAVEGSGGGWLIIIIAVALILVIGARASGHKPVKEREKEYRERMRKAGRKDIPSD